MEIIKKEGKDLEEILNGICEEYQITKDDFYYQYVEKKNGLFNKNSVIEVEVVLKSDLLTFVKEYLEELLTNMGLTVNFETKLREGTLFIKIYSNNKKGGNRFYPIHSVLDERKQNR